MEPPAGGPPPEELEERWRELQDALGEQPRNVHLLIRAGTLAEQMGRKHEAFNSYLKAVDLDPSQSFLVGKMRPLATEPDQQKEIERLSGRPATFAKALDGVFKYPVKGSGAYVLLLGALFLGAAEIVFLRMPNIVPILPVLLYVIVLIYMSMFYVDICRVTISGSDDLPEWPDFINIWGGISDFFKLYLPVILLSVPPMFFWGLALRAMLFGDAPFSAASSALIIVASIVSVIMGVVAILFVPIARLANVAYGSPFASLNVVWILGSVKEVLKPYLLCVLVFLGVSAAQVALHFVANLGGPFSFLAPITSALITIYGRAVEMRLLGVFFIFHKARMNWLQE